MATAMLGRSFVCVFLQGGRPLSGVLLKSVGLPATRGNFKTSSCGGDLLRCVRTGRYGEKGGCDVLSERKHYTSRNVSFIMEIRGSFKTSRVIDPPLSRTMPIAFFHRVSFRAASTNSWPFQVRPMTFASRFELPICVVSNPSNKSRLHKDVIVVTDLVRL